MRLDAASKYVPYSSKFDTRLPDRTWPDRVVDKAPAWCSVDLRDGNQALVNPMGLSTKLEMFALLVRVGFREIEVGFPSASQTEFDFVRRLIDGRSIPDHVVPQVLTQARDHLITRSFEAVRGAPRVNMHLYNSTSELQRRVVFRKGRSEIVELAVRAAGVVRSEAERSDADVMFEYSPESFTGTERDFALEICEAVIGEWGPTPERKMILNLPSTVEMTTPNVYADQIEWFCRRLSRRDSVIVSVHPHNDRGTGVASAELALMAGAERVEGTLFGNGERTGNVDVVTLALNLYSQGVDPGLALDDLPALREVCERCTELPVHPRHPYAGDLVFTAFSGSHQDAISKGLAALADAGDALWEVPYLPVDPSDVGRQYEPIIRINSQSGKGGVAFVLSSSFGCRLPKAMHPEAGAAVQRVTDARGKELGPEEVWGVFEEEFLRAETPYKLVRFRSVPHDDVTDRVRGSLTFVGPNGIEITAEGLGNGPVDACRDALLRSGEAPFQITDFSEHARSSGSDAEALAYVRIERPDGTAVYGAGLDANTGTAAVRALLSAVNRSKRAAA